MESAQYELNLIFEVPNVELYEYVGGGARLLKRGALGVYDLKEMSLIVLHLDGWQYSLNASVPVMQQSGGYQQALFILAKNGNGEHYGLVMSTANSEAYEWWVSLLSQRSSFLEGATPRQEAAKGATTVTSSAQGHHVVESERETLLGAAPGKQQQQQKEDEASTSKKIQGYLFRGGDAIKEGLIAGAKILQEGIVSAGEYLQGKITKQEPKPVSPETMAKVKMAKVASKGVLVYTQAQVTALVQGMREVGKVVVDEAASSETARKVQEHKYYPDAKNIAIGTAYGLAAVYEGMYEAMCCIGRGLQQATTGVVAKKYGTQAGEAVNDGMDAVGNVGAIGRAAKNAAVKEVRDIAAENQHKTQ